MTPRRTRLARAVLVLGLGLLGSAASGCRGGSDTPAVSGATAPRHLVIVTIDTLRADRLGAYGNTTVPTPHFDRLASEGVRAVDATTHVPITRPSHTSLFTGRYPPEHGVRDNISLPLAKDVPTLAEALKAAGFATAAFVSSFVLDSSSGLNRGFDHYDDAVDTGDGDKAVSISSAQRRGDDTLGKVEQWLDARPADVKAQRTALWIHLYDPHDPYEPPEPFATPLRGPALRRRGGVDRHAARPPARQSRSAAAVERRTGHRERRPRRGARRTRRIGSRVLRLRDQPQDSVRDACPGVPAGRCSTGRCASSTWRRRWPRCRPGAAAGATGRSIVTHLGIGAPPLTGTTYAESLPPLRALSVGNVRVFRDGT